MSQGEYRWNDIEVTWEDVDVDFFVIINTPWPGEWYVPERTIVFHMEPWCAQPHQTWGVKTWGEWAAPDPARFLQVRSHRNAVNNGFWQLQATYAQLSAQPIYKTRVIASICSGKYFDPGHIKRVDFLKFLEAKNDEVVRVHVYALENPLGFTSWRGPLPLDEKDAALLPYRYFFSAENNQESNFITEKLWEPLLTETLCFYWGAPNAADYVDSRAFIALDLDDFEGAFRTIKNAILTQQWEARLEFIRREKRKVLEQYQFFPTLERILLQELQLPPHPDDETVRFHKYFGRPVPDSIGTFCFIHSWTRNHDVSVLCELLDALQMGGLLNTVEQVYIINVGDTVNLPRLFDALATRIRLIQFSADASRGERPTLDLIRIFSVFQSQTRILYLHTKGVSYQPAHPYVDDWRRMLLYFLVENHQQPLERLCQADMVGCNLLAHPHRHFSGNFWWANAGYLRRLPVVPAGDRHQSEWWVLSEAAVQAVSLHDSRVDHYQDAYPPLRYRSPAHRTQGERASGTPSVCLCMIVKDEAHVVAQTLATVAASIDYWVIVDTGSSDDTMGIIQRFFLAQNIPGELHQRAWVDFGVNRSQVLALARDRADYLWMIDADDLLVGTIDFSRLSADAYLLRYGTDFQYWRTQVFSSQRAWHYEDALHEYPVCFGGAHRQERLEDAYHIESRRLGSRNHDPDKYLHDAHILLDQLRTKPDDARTVFYLAQSYRDAGDYRQALHFYTQRAQMNGWEEETFYALVQCGACMEHLGEPWEAVLAVYLRSWEHRPQRAEPLHHIARHYREGGQYLLGHLFASRACGIAYPADDLLFVSNDVYAWRIQDELSICSYYVGNFRESFDLCTQLLENTGAPESERARIQSNRDLCVPHLQALTLAYPAQIVRQLAATKPRGAAIAARVTLTITTCKRPELFEKTVNSFLNCCADWQSIDRWICIDDGSTQAQRTWMQERYPFFEFILKERTDKGHANSMNRLLETIDSPFWLHLEDDWHFFAQEHHVAKALSILADNPCIGQVLFNQNYAETLQCRSIVGGRVHHTAQEGTRYWLHQHIAKDTEDYTEFFKGFPPGARSNVWWPHYSLRPSLIRVSTIRALGLYDPQSRHFELEYAQRYAQRGYQSAFFDGVNALHIGKLTWETGGAHQANAYQLNDEPQFGVQRPDPISRPLRVQLVSQAESADYLRLLLQRQSTGDGRWEGIEVTLESDNIDYWAVLDQPGMSKLPAEKGRTIFFPVAAPMLQWTAPDPRGYAQMRSNQRYPSVAFWSLGMDYAALLQTEITKSLQLSCHTTSETIEPGQLLSAAFLSFLEDQGVAIDSFAPDNRHALRGYRGPVAAQDTRAAILPYRYTLVIEDWDEANFFSERLVDAILGECLCFYWGCTNLEAYLDGGAFVRLPLHDFDLSFRIMQAAMLGGEHERRLATIQEQKRRLLNQLQFFPSLAHVVGGHQMLLGLSVKVLNLDRRADRWNTFVGHMESVASPAFIERCLRLSAIDGHTLAMTPDIEHSFRGNDFAYRRGIVGCALSHISIWRDLARQQRGACLVFEDDAKPCHDFEGQLVAVCGELAELHADFDIVLLGWHYWNPPEPSTAMVAQEAVKLKDMEWGNYMGGTFAYLLSVQGAARLLALVERDGIQNGIDWFIMKKAPELKVLHASPQLVLSPLAIPGSAVDSDIQHDGVGVATVTRARV
jgi:GR25 family glycosyltransferase involved in LPS biosynthesis/glycosyltransferase involved in cell wall biosynthesis